jgi:hypothetical protein
MPSSAAECGVLDADDAYDMYTEAWDDWQLRGPDLRAGHEEPEAGR